MRAGQRPAKLERAGVWAVAVHAAVAVIHSAAHMTLNVKLSAWQNVHVWTVIVLLPLVAVALLRRRTRGGFALLGVSMFGSLLFGVHYHFIDRGGDHVLAHGRGLWPATFLVSAVLLALVEAAAVFVAVRGLNFDLTTDGDGGEELC
jgi:hypothetical protein